MTAGMTEIQSPPSQDVYKNAPDERLAELEWAGTGERLNRESFEGYSRIGGPRRPFARTRSRWSLWRSTVHSRSLRAMHTGRAGTGHPRTNGDLRKGARPLRRGGGPTHCR